MPRFWTSVWLRVLTVLSKVGELARPQHPTVTLEDPLTSPGTALGTIAYIALRQSPFHNIMSDGNIAGPLWA
jgi:hypothetical protein